MSSNPKCGICGKFIKLTDLDAKNVYDHSGIVDTLFYHKKCLTPPPMTNPPLPGSVIARIKEDAMNFFPPIVGDSAKTKVQIQNRVKYEEKMTQQYSVALALKDALAELVLLKHMKDEHGKTADYLYRQPLAWKAAYEALSKFPEQGKEGV